MLIEKLADGALVNRRTTKWDKAASTATQFCSWTIGVTSENNEMGSPEVTTKLSQCQDKHINMFHEHRRSL